VPRSLDHLVGATKQRKRYSFTTPPRLPARTAAQAGRRGVIKPVAKSSKGSSDILATPAFIAHSSSQVLRADNEPVTLMNHFACKQLSSHRRGDPMGHPRRLARWVSCVFGSSTIR
jgi:hypothetical protein